MTEKRLHIWVRWQPKDKTGQKRKLFDQMWKGGCDNCGQTWQFCFWGATLGYGLEHLRRCGR